MLWHHAKTEIYHIHSVRKNYSQTFRQRKHPTQIKYSLVIRLTLKHLENNSSKYQ